MYAYGFNWWLTKHGRKRFIERFGMRPDQEILEIAIRGADGYEFVWKPDKTFPLTGWRLITVLFKRLRRIYGHLSMHRTVLHSSEWHRECHSVKEVLSGIESPEQVHLFPGRQTAIPIQVHMPDSKVSTLDS